RKNCHQRLSELRTDMGYQIDFVESRPAYGPSGGVRAASYYIFQVDGKEVSIEVYCSSVSTPDGNLPPQKVKLAAKAFLEISVERVGLANLPENLLLDSPTMDFV